MKRILLPHTLLALPLAAFACARGPYAHAPPPRPTLAEAVRPAFLAEAMGRAGGGHYHGTARFAAGLGAADDGVTTTTDAWVDRAHNYRLSETNDRDGGRDVVRVGRELFVALRYGKMVRRVAEEPEPTKLLAEGLGGPWAAWELASPYAKVEAAAGASPGTTEYRVSRAAARTDAPATREADKGLRAWRTAVVVDTLTGHAVVDDATGALRAIDLAATFTTKRDGRDLKGAIDVHGALTDLGATAAIHAPPAEELPPRQRTVPEQRELLAGLPTTRALPPAPAKPGARSAPTAPPKPGARSAPAAPLPAPGKGSAVPPNTKAP